MGGAELAAGVHVLGQGAAPIGAGLIATGRVKLDGKFFRLDDQKFWVKGVTYGPFEPQANGVALPVQHQLEADLRQIRGLGANTIRVYHVPPRELLDAAHAFGIKVFVDVPWSKHRCFLESKADQETGRRAVREAARACREHPALFALSVVNEIPADVVRWLGHEKVERFIDELVDIAHQEDPGSLVTFASFPSTEYLHPERVDFYTMNVYLHKREKFRAYLQRLQNQADERPLLLGEYGIDSLRNGEEEQAELLAMHLDEAFGCGLAGTCCFSYTDEWFTGGHPITDWAFGLVRRDRSPKPAFHRVARVYRRKDPLPPLPRTPKVSVVVCSYNGSKTLDGCLRSLETLNYPDYEVILVNDGSTDSVPEIAARYPYIRYHVQENRGLSVARNVGMEMARGEIIAYTDDDCFADADWLYFLVAKLIETGASGVGGPNLLPTGDGPVAACVSASPGTPAHILIDDNVAEHIPGCNMAFLADRLRAIGGFDPVYTKAGDDVDLCWRLQEEGDKIVFAPAAMVWHHRRATVKAYLKQQRGYGEAEGLLKRKHPEKFRGFRADLSWLGRIYTRAGLGLSVGEPIIHHGVFGAGMFQTIYSAPQVWWPLMVLSLEWWTAVVLMLGLAPVLNPAAALAEIGVLGAFGFSPLANPLLILPVLMLLTTFGVSILVAGQASPPVHQRRWWSRLLIAAMHVAQPVERGSARYRTRFETIVIPEALHGLRRSWERRAGALLRRTQIDLWSENWTSREKLLESVLALTAEAGWFVRLDPGWNGHDVRFYGDRWCKADLVTVTENHGGGKLLTRVRLKPAATLFQKALLVLLGYVLVLAWGVTPSAALLVSPLLAAWVIWLRVSGARLRSVVMASVLTVAERLGMTVVGEPTAFEKVDREPLGAMAAMPMPGTARLATALSVPPLVRRTAGLSLTSRVALHR
ncbi:MAG: glycosyltransferase [Solirubrobacterales bacterium]|jgi:GT2 family glycosyltransferase